MLVLFLNGKEVCRTLYTINNTNDRVLSILAASHKNLHSRQFNGLNSATACSASTINPKRVTDEPP